jgi:hypothetical protein
MITKYFVIFGSFILLSVIVFADLFKMLMIPNDSYWSLWKSFLDYIGQLLRYLYQLIGLVLIDKTYIGAIFLS